MPAEIIARETVYEGWSTFEKVVIRLPDGSEVVREVASHGDAVAVLAYDPHRRTTWLITTTRAPVMIAGEPPLLEVPAGMIDADESPQAAMRRESVEEIGLRLGDLESLGAFWPSPGTGREKLHLFLAEASAADRVSEGGGLAEENEQIEVTEMSLAALFAAYERGEIRDLKTVVLLLELQRRRPQLFDPRAD